METKLTGTINKSYDGATFGILCIVLVRPASVQKRGIQKDLRVETYWNIFPYESKPILERNCQGQGDIIEAYKITHGRERKCYVLPTQWNRAAIDFT